MRRFSLSGLVALAAFAVPAMGVRADVNASVTPTCFDGCSTVAFELSIIGSPLDYGYTNSFDGLWYLNNFYLDTTGTTWAFNQTTAPLMGGAEPSSYGFTSSELNIDPDPYPAVGPVDFTVAFSDAGAMTDLSFGGQVHYKKCFVTDGKGGCLVAANQYDEMTVEMAEYEAPQTLQAVYLPPDPGESVEGTVTPEPATFLLLGTGLLGIAGVARRRRNLQQDGEKEL